MAMPSWPVSWQFAFRYVRCGVMNCGYLCGIPPLAECAAEAGWCGGVALSSLEATAVLGLENAVSVWPLLHITLAPR